MDSLRSIDCFFYNNQKKNGFAGTNPPVKIQSTAPLHRGKKKGKFPDTSNKQGRNATSILGSKTELLMHLPTRSKSTLNNPTKIHANVLQSTTDETAGHSSHNARHGSRMSKQSART